MEIQYSPKQKERDQKKKQLTKLCRRYIKHTTVAAGRKQRYTSGGGAL